MVGCVTLAAVPPLVSLTAPMTQGALTVSYVDQLKQQLQQALENDEESTFNSLIDEIEKLAFTKELLQVSRFGADLNALRKNISEKWPSIAKKCKNIIKSWQQLIQTTSSSATSSTNGTPNLMGKRVTPHTPVCRFMDLDTLPPDADFADLTKPIPVMLIHKSKSLTSHLMEELKAAEKADAEETALEAKRQNGKRRGEEIEALMESPIKRVKTVAGTLSSPSVSGTPVASSSGQSVLAARRQASLSTADMIAQMSSNLSSASDLNSAIRNHQIQVQREEADEQFAQSLASGASLIQSPYLRGKRKYERKTTKGTTTQSTTQIEPKSLIDSTKGALVVRLSRAGSNILDTSNEDNQPNPLEPSKESRKNDVGKYEPNPSTSTKVNWNNILPSIDELRMRAEKMTPVKPIRVEEGRKAHILKGRDRTILAMPLISDTVAPDFLVHNYSNKLRFYAEENFMYGRERPNEDSEG